MNYSDEENIGSPKPAAPVKEWWMGLGMRIPKATVYKAYGTSDTSFRVEMRKAGIAINSNQHFSPIEFEELCRKIYPPNEEVILDYIKSKLK